MAQNNLGTALWTLGERKDDTGLLKQARQAIGDAYEMDVKTAGLTQYEAYYQERLRNLDALIAARGGGDA